MMESPADALSVNSNIAELVAAHYELNGDTIEELDSEPSPLEFMRYVFRNTPFVIRGAASAWKATQLWDRDYMISALQGQTVMVAVTPHGNADAPTFLPSHGATVLAKPHEEPQLFDDFIRYIENQEDNTLSADSEVRYAQSQNDNMRDEYMPLFPDVDKDIAFARIALQKQPEAVNLWIGNSRSVTAMHKDNFENIFVQILGQKHFILLPPVCYAGVNEKTLHIATYSRQGSDLRLTLDETSQPVPFATWDPDDPHSTNSTPSSHLSRPLRVTLHPGDMLYIPAMWYHKVKQSCADDGNTKFVAAINYWYDMEYRGPLYALTSFLRMSDRMDAS